MQSIWGDAEGPASLTTTSPPAQAGGAQESYLRQASTRVTFKNVIHRDAVTMSESTREKSATSTTGPLTRAIPAQRAAPP